MMGGFVEALLGALVGGILAYFGAMRSARFTMEKTAVLDRKRRKEERAQVQSQLTSQLLAEIKDNLRILETPKLEWGFAVIVHDIWDTAKGQLIFSSIEVGDTVKRAYTQVYLYNALVAAATVDRQAIDFVRNYTFVEDRAAQTRAALERAAQAIEQGTG